MDFKNRTIKEIAGMVCGNFETDKSFFRYRSSKYLTEFFSDCGTAHHHDGSTRDQWVAAVLKEILAEPQAGSSAPPATFARVIRTLMDPGDSVNEGPERTGALALLNTALGREGFEAFYGPDKLRYLRDLGTGAVAGAAPSQHRPFTAAERERRELLTLFLEKSSEDELIEEVLLPLFRQLGFHRVTAAGHKDKALEYGKDVWMRYRPTMCGRTRPNTSATRTMKSAIAPRGKTDGVNNRGLGVRREIVWLPKCHTKEIRAIQRRGDTGKSDYFQYVPVKLLNPCSGLPNDCVVCKTYRQVLTSASGTVHASFRASGVGVFPCGRTSS